MQNDVETATLESGGNNNDGASSYNGQMEQYWSSNLTDSFSRTQPGAIAVGPAIAGGNNNADTPKDDDDIDHVEDDEDLVAKKRSAGAGVVVGTSPPRTKTMDDMDDVNSKIMAEGAESTLTARESTAAPTTTAAAGGYNVINANPNSEILNDVANWQQRRRSHLGPEQLPQPEEFDTSTTADESTVDVSVGGLSLTGVVRTRMAATSDTSTTADESTVDVSVGGLSLTEVVRTRMAATSAAAGNSSNNDTPPEETQPRQVDQTQGREEEQPQQENNNSYSDDAAARERHSLERLEEDTIVVGGDQDVPQPIVAEAVVDNTDQLEEENRMLAGRVRRMETLLHEQQNNTVQATMIVVEQETPNGNGGGGNGDNNKANTTSSFITKYWKKLLLALLTIIVVVVVIVVSTSSTTKEDPNSAGSPTTQSPANDDKSSDAASDNDNESVLTLLPPFERILQRGHVVCGAATWPLSHDLCRAVAAAIFGDPERHELVFMVFSDYWPVLGNGTIDLITHTVNPLMHRDVYGFSDKPEHRYPITLTLPYAYTGTNFEGIPEYVDCADRGDTFVGICRDLSVCVSAGTSMRDAVEAHLDGTNFVEVAGTVQLDRYKLFYDGVCNAVANVDIIANTTILFEDLGYDGPFKKSQIWHDKAPLSIGTRGDDHYFGDFVNWVVLALVRAEAMNITQETAYQFPKTQVFGKEYENMFIDALSAVGNYAELYERNYGKLLPRHPMNQLNHGDTGMMFSYPLGDTKIPFDLDEELIPKPTPNGTLEAIYNLGRLRCGIVVGDDHSLPKGFAMLNTTSVSEEWFGFHVELCRGLDAALFSRNSGSLEIVPFDTYEEAFVGLSQDTVDVIAGAPFNLANDVKEPTTSVGFAFGPIHFYGDGIQLAVATREDDVQFNDFIRWMVFATINAEEEGITSGNAFEMPVIDLFGSQYQQAFRDIIGTIGNYGEIYNRTLQAYLPRSGRNRLNTQNTAELFPFWEFNA